MTRNKFYAFTLVELLVVIAMIGILVSMILPGIQSSREAARRNMCLNNVREIILAIHNYELAEEVFPSGTLNDSGPVENRPEGQHISWIAPLLPYLGEQNKFEHLDLALSAYHRVNDDVRQLMIPKLLCPSEVNRLTSMSSYAGNHHDLESPIDSDNNGIFFLNSQLSGDDLEDGARYTIFLGEKITIAKYDLGWLSGTPGTLRNAGDPVGQEIELAINSTLAPWQVKTTESETEKEFLPHSLLGGNPKEPARVGGFGSHHVEGANFAFGDGSVRFLSAEVSGEMLQQLCNRRDGMLIDAAEIP